MSPVYWKTRGWKVCGFVMTFCLGSIKNIIIVFPSIGMYMYQYQKLIKFNGVSRVESCWCKIPNG